MKGKATKNAIIEFKVLSGIDTLYYFYQSDRRTYPDIFAEILQQLATQKKQFEAKEVDYENRDLKADVNGHIFDFNGKAQGFYWFNHIDNFFSVGLKDSTVNVGVHDIQIQLSAVGIYTLGLKQLLAYVDTVFENLATKYKPITRADLNIFAQIDLSWLQKDMFVSRKRKYTTHSKEISSKYRLQTLYIGQAPFRLRLYDKKEELKTSAKKDLMYQYFQDNGLDIEDEIFNIEFELHRKFLRSFGIDTVDDLLANAEKLFGECMNSIRLVDLTTISGSSINSYNRYKAHTHPLWLYISERYRLEEFLSTDKPLVKIKRPQYLYTVEQAIEEHIKLAKRAELNNVVVDEQFYLEVLSALGKICKRGFGELYSQNKGPASEAR